MVLGLKAIVCEVEHGAGASLSRIVPEKWRLRGFKRNLTIVTSKKNMLSCNTQLFWTENPVTSCSTSLVTLTWKSVSSLKKKTLKKYLLSCIYLLDKCKRVSSFSCANPVKDKNPFWFDSHLLHFLYSVNGCSCSLFYVNLCVEGRACVRWISLKMVWVVMLYVSRNA